MTTMRASLSTEPCVTATASETGPFRSCPGSNFTWPEDNEAVSPHARGPVFASSVTVQGDGTEAAFDTDRATGKMVARANGELRGWVIGCSAYVWAMATSGF